MGMGAYPVFCGRDSVFHSECHIGDHVQEYGHVQRGYRHVYRTSLSAVDGQASLEPFRGHHQDQEMVDTGQ